MQHMVHVRFSMSHKDIEEAWYSTAVSAYPQCIANRTIGQFLHACHDFLTQRTRIHLWRSCANLKLLTVCSWALTSTEPSPAIPCHHAL